MNSIAFLDLISILASLAGFVIILSKWQKVTFDIKIQVSAIFLLSFAYAVILFFEWDFIGSPNENLENFIGALIPMIWGYLFYTFIQEAGNNDLLESRRQLEMAIKGTRAGVWDWNILTHEIRANERMAEIIGYTLAELNPLTVQSLSSFIHPDDSKVSEPLLMKHLMGELDFFEQEYRVRHKSGSWVWVVCRGMVVERNAAGEPLRMAGTHIDISNQKLVEASLQEQMDMNRDVNRKYLAQNERLKHSLEHIREINQELLRSKEKAEESDRLKSAFLSNMSHEIRTPMNGIIGFSSMLLKPDLPESKRMYYARIIINSGNQLLAIVNDILDISRIETGMVEISNESVNLNLLLDDLYSFFKPQAAAKDIDLTVYLEDSGEQYVTADKVRLKQVLSNLLHNAVKFTFSGSIEFGYVKAGPFIHFYVKDSGIGISKDLFDVIFKPFRQVELEITRVPGGTGLGLSISKKLVELMGGEIWLESEPGAGTTFYFKIPLKYADTSREASGSDILPEVRIEPGTIKLLLAEDDEISYLYLKEITGIYGIELKWAKNGIEAVEACLNDSGINMVLMDIKMPGMNGIEATRKIRETRPDLPVIAVTAFAKSEDKTLALSAGCNDFLSKPIKREELLSVIIRYGQRKY